MAGEPRSDPQPGAPDLGRLVPDILATVKDAAKVDIETELVVRQAQAQASAGMWGTGGTIAKGFIIGFAASAVFNYFFMGRDDGGDDDDAG